MDAEGLVRSEKLGFHSFIHAFIAASSADLFVKNTVHGFEAGEVHWYK